MNLARIHDLVRPYTEKNDLKAAWESISTLLVLIPLGIALYQFRDYTLFWLLASIPGALMLLRMFALGHEAGHVALFKSRRANLWAGRFVALFSLIPYSCWHRMHYVHHQRLGQIDDAHEGYMWLMTRREYEAASPLTRRLYRTYHHPLTLFVVGPVLQSLSCQERDRGRGTANAPSFRRTHPAKPSSRAADGGVAIPWRTFGRSAIASSLRSSQ